MVSFASSIMKNVNLLLFPLRFPVRLICCIVFGSESSAFCLLKSITIMLFEIKSLANNPCVIIFLTSFNFRMFSYAFISFLIGWSKKVLPPIKNYSLLLLQLENNIFSVLFYYHCIKWQNKKSIYSLKTWVN